MAEQNPGWSGDAQSFYHEFTLRNAGFISDEEQQRLRNAVAVLLRCWCAAVQSIWCWPITAVMN